MIMTAPWFDSTLSPRHRAKEVVAAMTLEHKTCGAEQTPKLICGECGEELHPRDVRAHTTEAVA